MQHYRGLRVISSLLESPMMVLIIGWLKTVAIAVTEVAKVIVPISAVVYINYGVSKQIPCSGTDDEEFISHIILAVVFSAIQFAFVCAMRVLIQREEIQAARSFIVSIYTNIRNAYLDSKIKLEKDMREFDIEAQMLLNKAN